jgi:hypothetical protein
MMVCAFLVATRFRYGTSEDEETPLQAIKGLSDAVNIIKNKGQFERKQFVNEPDEDDEANGGSNFNNNTSSNQSQSLTAMYMELFSVCATLRIGLFFFMIWFMGVGVGIVFNFLFWHLQGNLYSN